MKVLDLSKVAVALSLAGFLSGVAVADELDSEIAKLKKENELLELKQKNEALKKGVKSAQKSNETQEASASDLSGWFVGAELGYSPSVTNWLTQPDNLTIPLLSSSTYALPINLAFGYQIYPWQNAGFKFRGYVGYANYNSVFEYRGQELDFKSQAIHYGLEAEYLYDFVASQTHTFGLSIGLGYEFGTFMGQNTINGTYEAKMKGYTSSSLTSSAGVHYYYNINHQFELKYRYRSGYDYDNGGEDEVMEAGVKQKTKYASSAGGSILFAYNYKF